MAISFLQVPTGVKVPGVYTEVDPSKANQGPNIQPHKVLLVGSRLAAGTKAAGTIDLLSSDSQAREFYGPGSILSGMASVHFGENKINSVSAIALDDDGGAVKASGSYEIVTAPTADGTLVVMIGGREYKVAVDSADTEAAIITALIASVNADADAYVTALVNGGNADQMDITAKNGGVTGNDIDIRENFYVGQELPVGITTTIVAMASGATNPSVAAVITAMGETQFHEIVIAYSDAANLNLFQVEMQDRWGPIRANDGHVYFAKKESFSTHITFLDSRNNEQESVMNIAGPTPTWEWAANMAAIIAREAQNDPALPFQTVDFTQVKAPKDAEFFSFSERDQMLKAGSSTFNLDPNGFAQIERMRTTRVENDFAAADESLADLNPKLTLSYLRFDFRVNHLVKFSRHKLVDDGTRVGPGQRVISPKIGKAEAIARFRLWEELGLVEGAEQFKNDIIVERNAADPTRLDYRLGPDLANQLRVAGVQFQFLL